ncbi:MAG: hypothetical protein ACHQ4J_13465 [Candidatus Binatia bacterium]
MKLFRGTVTVAVGLGLSAMSCGGGGGNAAQQQSSAEQACSDLAAANCERLDECIQNGVVDFYGDVATCQARQQQSCVAVLNAPGGTNTDPTVEQCAAAISSASCEDFDLGNIPCFYAGTRAIGQPCGQAVQCVSGAYCAIVTGTNCGTCAAPAQPGDSCMDASCSHGLVCVSENLQCQPLGGSGSACDTDHRCGPGLWCVPPAAGTCDVAGAAVSVPCDPTGATAPGCDINAGLYCDARTNTCLPVAYASAGGRCGYVNGTYTLCTDASACIAVFGQPSGACKAAAQDGMPCSIADGPPCLPPARCVTGNPTATSGTCKFPDPAACT